MIVESFIKHSDVITSLLRFYQFISVCTINTIYVAWGFPLIFLIFWYYRSVVILATDNVIFFSYSFVCDRNMQFSAFLARTSAYLYWTGIVNQLKHQQQGMVGMTNFSFHDRFKQLVISWFYFEHSSFVNLPWNLLHNHFKQCLGRWVNCCGREEIYLRSIWWFSSSSVCCGPRYHRMKNKHVDCRLALTFAAVTRLTKMSTVAIWISPVYRMVYRGQRCLCKYYHVNWTPIKNGEAAS